MEISVKIKIFTICFIVLILLTGGSIYKKSELVKNGKFDGNDDTGWTLSSAWSVANEKLDFNVSDDTGNAQFTLNIKEGREYRVQFDFAVLSGVPQMAFYLGGDELDYQVFQGNGFKEYLITAGDADSKLQFFCVNGGFIGTHATIDNVSVKEVKKKVCTKKE